MSVEALAESNIPPSVLAVATAIPAFLGYTAAQQYRGEALLNRPVAVNSFVEFTEVFGGPPPVGMPSIALDERGAVVGGLSDPGVSDLARFRLAYALQHFYDNGGGRCYVMSIGDFTAPGTAPDIAAAHRDGLDAMSREDEPTLLVLPDLSGMPGPAPSAIGDERASGLAATRADYHSVLAQALDQCATRGDRFLICDLWDGAVAGSDPITAFRDGIGSRNLRYGAAYHPFVQTTLPWNWDERQVSVSQPARRNDDGTVTRPSPHDKATLAELKSDAITANAAIYANVRTALSRFTVTLPPAAAVAGVYTSVDRTRGVWKAPANESLASSRALTVAIDQTFSERLTTDSSGTSINALRVFPGKGVVVWGARTLAGSDNEWRYVSVRRFVNMVEKSCRKASERFVFEPNDANTWRQIRGMIEDFLILQWRAGALTGARPDEAFFVRVGLGSTMTAQDILDGRMIVEIGMAVVRPAEFIVLRFTQAMTAA